VRKRDEILDLVRDAKCRDWRGFEGHWKRGQECPTHTFFFGDALSTCQAQEMQRSCQASAISCTRNLSCCHYAGILSPRGWLPLLSSDVYLTALAQACHRRS